MSQSKGGGDGESKSRMKTGGARVGEREGGGGRVKKGDHSVAIQESDETLHE